MAGEAGTRHANEAARAAAFDRGELARALRRTTLAWKLALISLPLDLLVLAWPTPFKPEPAAAEAGSLLLLAAAVGLSFRPLVLRLMALRRTGYGQAAAWRKGLVYGVIGVVAAAGLLQCLAALIAGDALKALAIVAFYATAGWSMLHKFVSVEEQAGKTPEGSPAAQAQASASLLKQLYYLAIARIVLARSMSLWAVVVTASGAAGAIYCSVYALLALLMLLAAAPAREQFIGRCRRCSQEMLLERADDMDCAECRPVRERSHARAERRAAKAAKSIGQRIEDFDRRVKELLGKRLEHAARARSAGPSLKNLLLQRLRPPRRAPHRAASQPRARI